MQYDVEMIVNGSWFVCCGPTTLEHAGRVAYKKRKQGETVRVVDSATGQQYDWKIYQMATGTNYNPARESASDANHRDTVEAATAAAGDVL